MSQAFSDLPLDSELASQASYDLASTLPSSRLDHLESFQKLLHVPVLGKPSPHRTLPDFGGGFTKSWLGTSSDMSPAHVVDVLVAGNPGLVTDYAEHLFRVSSLLFDGAIDSRQRALLERKFSELTDALPSFIEALDPLNLKLYLVVEKCFDVFIKIATNVKHLPLATLTIRFLTTVVMSLNYWEIYNLLQWRPAIYQFLMLIDFDLNESYSRFMRDYHRHTYNQELQISSELYHQLMEAGSNCNLVSSSNPSSPVATDDDAKSSAHSALSDPRYDPELGVQDDVVVENESLPQKVVMRKKIRLDSKSGSQKIINHSDKHSLTSRSSNYDPDVIHECHLPSSDEPNKMCLRRFSRKYELIRHQETVHSKKKKLFKCFVCVKTDPMTGPRIFTRHDTLAKHIRVNHKISGKEAKAEVAYSKKHAEIVEEGDITVHVGRRKTKVDFELRKHMERKGHPREGVADSSIVFDDIDDSPPDSIQSDEETMP